MIAAAAVQTLSAQIIDIRKNAWFDFQVAQHVGLNKWNDVGYANDGLPRAAVTEFRGVFNLYIARPVGTFLDMGLGIMPAAPFRSLNNEHMPQPNSGTKYYLREVISESGTGAATAHFKITWGLFGNIRANDKIDIMPYFGIGGMSMSRRSHEMILKEDGTNMQYRVFYSWGSDISDYYGDGYDDYGGYYDYSDSSSDMLGYITGRVNFKYRVNPRMCLMFGLEYTHFYETTNFYGRFVNTFNGNVRKSIAAEGNKMNMLGVSVGISFK